jgi:hypothetical protein
LNINTSYNIMPAMATVVQSFEKADKLMMEAVNKVSDGDIIDAAMLINQAKLTAKSAAGVARAANEISGTLLDILA